MLEDRFWDKAHLSSYSLDTRIFDQFGLTVSDASPIRSVFLLSTNEGYKILKKITYPMKELMFLHNALEKIQQAYPYIVRFRRTLSGSPFLEKQLENGSTELYVVLDLIEGRECIFENPIDLAKASSALAQFHLAAGNAGLACDVELRDNSHKMPAIFQGMLEKLQHFETIARLHVNKTEFDDLFLENYSYHRSQANEALEVLCKSPYHKLCEKKRTLCHHDLAHHNILIGIDENVYFIDFDYVLMDLPYHDLANLIRKVSRSCGWSVEAYNRITSAYAAVAGLTLEEQQVLYAYMLFPYDFYTTANFYYSKIKDWEEEEHLDKLTKKMQVREERSELLSYIRQTLQR